MMQTRAERHNGVATTEALLLVELRALRRVFRHPRPSTEPSDLTLGQKVADALAATMGSWPFIIIQSVLLAGWIAVNVTAVVEKWDPYPFILLNLALSFQAAYAAPFIMIPEPPSADRSPRGHERPPDQH